MAVHATRRSLLVAGASTVLIGAAGARASADPSVAAVACSGFRVVRAQAGEPSAPAEIVLPAGYTVMTANRVSSRAEYLAFVQGERNDAGVPVTVRWPGERIKAVINGERRLPLTEEPGGGVTFTLPIYRTSVTADSPTVQVWSYLSRHETGSGLYWHVEHNDPDRAAGVWQTVPWPTGETQAVISWMVATREILEGSGLIAEAQRRGHFYALMGFETNNPLHLDNPPHWHMSYYPGPTMAAARATVPHYWVDRQGRVFYNGQDVQGAGRTPYRVGQPAPIHDAEGALVVTTTIRADGGLDIDPPTGPRYSIVSPTGTDFTGRLRILRDGVVWRAVTTNDNYRNGRLRLDVQSFGSNPSRRTEAYDYDELTGMLLPG